MNELLPIIRRVRRPLLPVEAPADAKPAVVPVQAKGESAHGNQNEQRKNQDGKAAASEAAKQAR